MSQVSLTQRWSHETTKTLALHLGPPYNDKIPRDIDLDNTPNDDNGTADNDIDKLDFFPEGDDDINKLDFFPKGNN